MAREGTGRTLVIVARFEGNQRRFALPHGAVRIGSAPGNDLILPFSGISRRHAILRREGSNVTVLDLDSRHGVLIDGRRQKEAVVLSGGTFWLGRTRVDLEDVDADDVQIALPMEDQPLSISREALKEALKETDSLHGDRETAGPEAALAFLREVFLSTGGVGFLDADRLLTTRKILTADSVFVALADDNSEAELEAYAGERPGLEALRAALRERDPSSLLQSAGRVLVSAPGGASSGERRCVGALLSAAQSSAEAWQIDLVSFLATGLIGQGNAHATVRPVSPVPESGRVHSSGRLILSPEMVVGASRSMAELLDAVRSTLGSRLNALILGETGTGKKMFAQMLHDSGANRDNPFVLINCMASPADQFDVDLFGVQGRIEIGVESRRGLLFGAGGGTIFLKEVGELAKPLQAKLLRFLQEGEIHPLGGTGQRKERARVIASSSLDLGQAVERGDFRADLFFHLRGLEFHIPPLRERKDDLPILVRHFLRSSCGEYQKRVLGLSRGALDLILDYPWPGNIRELRSELERAVLLCRDDEAIRAEHLGALRSRVGSRSESSKFGEESATDRRKTGLPDKSGSAEETVAPEGRVETGPFRPLRGRIEQVERTAIVEALEVTKGNRSHAAALLGVTRAGLLMKIRRLLKNRRPG